MEQKIIVEYLVEKVSPLFIILFGSAVKGNFKHNSDYDIAFLSNEQYDSYQLFLRSQELAEKLHREVDLIDLSRASTVFKAQIIHTGKAIYCKDKLTKDHFDIKTMKMYAKLNEERLPIMRSIDESGSIYEQ
ncbi:MULTISPECIES: type VII toxin-antitoxin system MntA family adenylyltransferase antitoxin [Bacillaceae]|uniref:Nucleotidyltransferase domain-containing protein n=1 Tax=Evansella alkalicola TaxID=745819 RepID=A0ABS6JYY6_9BACI|nr:MULTISPECIES: nucleotidyltransferase domain-containing protein [Bacillaceae]MBU9722879.1 nucleotidyltransferase domain-containing protein [Bacillus alkalicola]